MLIGANSNSGKFSFKKYVKQGNLGLDFMFLPGLILLIIFNIVPMYGILMAFQDFVPSRGLFGSEWVGLQNFIDLINYPNIGNVVKNTFVIAILKIVIGFPIPIIFSLLLNEIRQRGIKKGIQTLIYLPNFISWVVMSGVILDIFSVNGGIVNNIITMLGGDPKNFMGDNAYFVPILIITEIWKSFGWGTVIYLASLSAVDPTLYESCVIDGAKRWKQTLAVTLPAMLPIILLSGILKLGDILNAGFDQVFNLYNELVYETADIIDTFVYRLAFDGDYAWSLSTLVGLIKSLFAMIFILSGWGLAKKFTNYSVF